jgi:hypothetical protein
MAIHVAVESRKPAIIVWTVGPSFNWDEYEQANHRNQWLVDSLLGKVYAILDLRKLRRPPKDLLSHLPLMARDVPPRQRMLIAVGAAGFVQMAVAAFSREYRPVEQVSTLQEAHVLIAQDYSGLTHPAEV